MFDAVPGVGLEPTLHCCNKILSLARLPIPPPRHVKTKFYSSILIEELKFDRKLVFPFQNAMHFEIKIRIILA